MAAAAAAAAAAADDADAPGSVAPAAAGVGGERIAMRAAPGIPNFARRFERKRVFAGAPALPTASASNAFLRIGLERALFCTVVVLVPGIPVVHRACAAPVPKFSLLTPRRWRSN